ncbi:hypothetical protein D9M68_847570 [compost metagenome]
MMKCGSHLTDDGPAWLGTRADGQVMPQEALNEGPVDLRSGQPFFPHPIAEMRDAAQICPNGAPGIASSPKSLQVRRDQFIQRAVSQPVTARKVRQAFVGEHGGLLERS